jgi:hypothetical protein
VNRILLLLLLLSPAIASSQEDPEAVGGTPASDEASDEEPGGTESPDGEVPPAGDDGGDEDDDDDIFSDDDVLPFPEDVSPSRDDPPPPEPPADPAVDETAAEGEGEGDGAEEEEPRVIMDEDGNLILPPPQNIGGLAILPLDTDLDVVDLIRHLHVEDSEAVLLVTGATSDRYSVNGIRLQLPPPFLVFQLDTGVSVVAVVRGAEIHEERVPTMEGSLSHFDTDAVLAGRKTDAEEDIEVQRALLADLYAALDDTPDIVEKIRICIRFVDVYPEGSATEKARAILADLRAKIADEDESSLDLSDEAQAEMEKLRRQEAFAMSPRPPGTAGRKVGGFTFLGGAVALGVGAVAFDQSANSAAATYHQLVLESTEAAGAPYLDQARRNDQAFKASMVAAITCGTVSVVLLISDALIHQRWLRVRDRLEIDDEEPSYEPEAALVPAPLDGGFGVALGGTF